MNENAYEGNKIQNNNLNISLEVKTIEITGELDGKVEKENSYKNEKNELEDHVKTSEQNNQNTDNIVSQKKYSQNEIDFNDNLNFNNNINIKKYSCNFCFSVDNISCKICNLLTYIGYYMCIPFKYCLKAPLSQFERPYSFIMIVNYFILVIPIILLTVGYIQKFNVIFDKFVFGAIYSYVYICLLLNYYFTFHIYDKYGIHKLNKPKYKFTSTTFLKYIYWYLFYEHKFGFVILFILVQIISSYPITNYLNNLNNNNEKIKANNVPVIIFFVQLAVNCNLALICFHALIYGLLLLIILCKLNGSCLCLILSNWLCCWNCCYEDSIDILGTDINSDNKKNDEKLEKHNINNSNKDLNNQPYDVIECKSNDNNLKIHSKNISLANSSNKAIGISLNMIKINNKINLGEEINTIEKEKNKHIKYRVSKSKGVFLNENTAALRTLPFIERLLEFFKFIKIFEYDKELGDGEKILKDI